MEEEILLPLAIYSLVHRTDAIVNPQQIHSSFPLRHAVFRFIKAKAVGRNPAIFYNWEFIINLLFSLVSASFKSSVERLRKRQKQ